LNHGAAVAREFAHPRVQPALGRGGDDQSCVAHPEAFGKRIFDDGLVDFQFIVVGFLGLLESETDRDVQIIGLCFTHCASLK
jgi:hypothetical protein